MSARDPMPLETPADLLAALGAICPGLHGEWEAGEEPASFHDVMRRFTDVFGSEAARLAPRELARVGAVLSEAVQRGGELENAVSTCLLEHLHQIRAWKAIKPYLSEAARQACSPR